MEFMSQVRLQGSSNCREHSTHEVGSGYGCEGRCGWQGSCRGCAANSLQHTVCSIQVCTAPSREV
jgi:hypothetical protein